MGSPVQRLPEFGQIAAVTMGYGVVSVARIGPE
jgi:hypothetical protein